MGQERPRSPAPPPPLYEPPMSYRICSALTIGSVGAICRGFLYGFSTTEAHGLDHFLHLLDKRRDPSNRERGLITVSNHLSVYDDPMIWGVLPFRYHWDGNNMRWGLGSYDICFRQDQSSWVSRFFAYGNTLPTHRIAHSTFGGLFQPTMTQVIRLLSDPHPALPYNDTLSTVSDAPADPFSSPHLTYSTNALDTFPAPSAYRVRRHSWVHIFPEGMIHQHPQKVMRYFKWGIARLILEAEPCPDVLPMWIDGPQWVMNETRTWPRPVPRPGKEISVTFGEPVDREKVFGPFRERWRQMKEGARRKRMALLPRGETLPDEPLGELHDEELRYAPEAEQLRIDVALAVRNEVLKVRRSRGLPDEDPKRSMAATFRKEGVKREGQMDDGSVVRDT